MVYNKICRRSIFPLLILLAITVAWCWVYNITSTRDLQIPNAYDDDGVAVYAIAKAFASGEISPGLFKQIDTLNAPFSANWNDYPFEDLVYFPAAFMANIFGLSAGLWLYLLASQLLAGLSFFVTARLLDLTETVSASCAVLFALSGVAFTRGIGHLTVTIYWHLPLLLITLLWCLDPTKVKLSSRQGLCLGIVSGLLAGIYNPYYWFIFFFLMIIILTGVTYRKEWPQTIRVTAITAAALFGFLALNADTILFSLFFGKGQAITRGLFELVAYGLRLPDLALPPPGSRLHVIFDPIFNNYRMMYPEFLKGEAEQAYVGIVALTGLVMLALSNTVRLAGRAFDQINNLYWLVLGVFSFAVIGGINYLLGAFGFILLRSTNRYSILLMAIGLLYISHLANSIKNRKVVIFIAIFVLTLGLYDQLPAPSTPTAKIASYNIMIEDQTVAQTLDSRLSPGAMVFQLPVKPFPEASNTHKMGAYDHFRPWLWTKNIRYSYGTMKGRGDADWQDVLVTEPLQQALEDLNRYGFSALLINRNAYEDRADKLKHHIAAFGYELIIEKNNYYGFKLKPVAHPGLPNLSGAIVSYELGFYGPEKEGSTPFRWADRDAILTVNKPFLLQKSIEDEQIENIELSFTLRVIGERSVWIEVGPNKELVSQKGEKFGPVRLNLKVSSLPVSIHIFSDKPGEFASGGDPRRLAFNVRDLTIVPR